MKSRRTSGARRPRPRAADDARSDRRLTILAAAAKLFAENGVSGTTVRDIGDAAGILSGSLYYYFDSKESMVKDIVVGYVETVVASYGAVRAQCDDPYRCLEGLIVASFQAVARGPYACEIFQNEYKYLRTLPELAELHGLVQQAQRHWLEVIEAGVAQGQFRDDIDPKVFYRLAREAVWRSVRWYRPSRDLPVELLAQQCVAILMSGYATGATSTAARTADPRPRGAPRQE